MIKIQEQFKVIDKVGLRARVAVVITNVANLYKSDITTECNKQEANLKSVLGTMSLDITENELIIVTAIGQDSLQAINHLSDEFNKIAFAKKI